MVGPPHELGAEGVALDVSADRQEMVIALNRKRLETPLVDRPPFRRCDNGRDGAARVSR